LASDLQRLVNLRQVFVTKMPFLVARYNTKC